MKIETQDAVLLALEATRFARFILGQISMAEIEKLPPEVHQQLSDERDRVNQAWAALAPKG